MVAGMFLPLRVLLTSVTLRASPSIPPSLRSALAHVTMCSHVQNYTGGVFGVYADVSLNMRTRVARVKMRGVPIGGSVEGTGWLASPDVEVGGVVLEPEFEAKLRRRGIKIIHAALSRSENTVTVTATVPVLGSQRIVLRAVVGPPPISDQPPAGLCSPPSSPPATDLFSISNLIVAGGML